MKSDRQQQILNLIKDRICLTQEDLQQGLLEMGYDVTQSTISRDIKQLKLVKGRDELGNYRYIYNSGNVSNQKDLSHFHQLFSKTVKFIKYSFNNVVIKCDNGMAQSACVAVDQLFGDMMVGSLAGDDTIIIVTDSEEKSKILTDNLNKLL